MLIFEQLPQLRVVFAKERLILIVVVVPERVEDWLQQTEASLCLQRCGYWSSLAGADSTENKENITVIIPRNQVFTPTILELMMQKVLRGEKL
ncbi:MAG: DUF4365 domain-containing protein [Hormoscilla sp. SP12CHS1]|nr:DUF4365 domain-containing protein [Hormoscilla sp. SP12CHS1]